MRVVGSLSAFDGCRRLWPMALSPHILVIGLAIVVLLLLATWPQLLALHRLPVFVHLVAVRGLLVMVSVSGALVFGIMAWRSNSWWYGVIMVGALVIVASLNFAIMVSRGFAVHEVRSDRTGDLTVFTWNMLRDGPDSGLVADFALKHGVDVLSLSETSPAAAHEIRRLMEDSGRSMQVFMNTFDESSESHSTVLLVSSALGDYAVDASVGSTLSVPSVVAKPVDGVGPTLIAAHIAPSRPSMMRSWLDGLSWLAERCRKSNVIVAGDFNATVDHFSGLRESHADIGACRDGAMALGSAGLGTWPSQIPPFMGSPVDHIVAAEQWEFVEFRIVLELDGSGSDHRALLARLRQLR